MTRVTITIFSPTRALIEGTYDEAAMDEHFSFRKSKFWFRSPAAKAGQWDGKTHLYDRAAQTIPIGLVSDARKLLRGWGHRVKTVDKRPPNPLTPLDETPKLGGVTLRDYQERAVEKALAKERGIIHGATGCGKTELAAAIIRRLASKDGTEWPVTLFLTGRKALATQTHKRFAERLCAAPEDIGLIAKGKWTDGRLPIYVAIVDTFTSKKWAAKRRTLNAMCQVMFLDEAHHAGSSSWHRTASYCKARYRFGLTGTPVGRSDSGDLYLRASCGQVVARIKSTELIAQGHLAEPFIFFIEIKRPHFVEMPKTPWIEIYNRGIVHCASRNRIVRKYANQLRYRKMKTLILVRSIHHGALLNNDIEDSVFVSGKTDASTLADVLHRFENLDLHVLIASSIFDEGVDIPAIDALLIASGGKSAITTLQRIGRGLRPKRQDNRVFVFDFYDKTNSYLQAHAEKRIDVCKSEGFTTRILDTPKKIGELIA